MNIFDFINSHDVAEHLEKIGYRFSPVEEAWLVWQSKNHTMKEKHAMWHRLIDTREDCSLKTKKQSFKYQKSLHWLLQTYMDRENALAVEFLRPDDRCVYTYKTLFEDDNSWCEEHDVFANFEDAFASFSENVNLNPRFAEFTKTRIGSCESKIYCRMTSDRRITEIYRNFWSDDEAETFCYFNNLTFRFPTPFKEGDVLTPVCGKYTRLPPVGGTFVLCHGDTESDRSAELYGYFADGDYRIYREIVDDSVINLIDYEYVHTELEDEDRLLLPISEYLKKNIGLESLLSSHRILITH